MLHLILKNILFHPVRNGALVIAFALIAASLFAGNYLITGAAESIGQEISLLGADIIVVPEQYRSESEGVLLRGEPSTFFLEGGTADRVEKIPGIARVSPQLYIATLPADCCSELVQIIAIDPAKDFTITPWLNQSLKRPLQRGEIITGSDITGEVGSEKIFYGQPFVVAGHLRPTGTGVDRTVFLRIDDAEKMADGSATVAAAPFSIPKGAVSVILVKVRDSRDTEEVAGHITSEIKGVNVITAGTLTRHVAARLESITRLLESAGLAAACVVLPLIVLISIMAASERRRETGILRALGATRRRIFSLVVGEAALVAAIGGGAGVAGSAVLLFLFQTYISVSLGIPLAAPGVLPWVVSALTATGFTTVLGGFAALIPAAYSAMREPSELIRSGDV